MGFFKRLSDGMFAPKEVFKYHNDKWYTTLLFFLFLAIVSLLPSTVNMLMTNGLDYQDKREIKTIFHGENIHFQIDNNVLVNNDNENKDYSKKFNDSITIIFTTNNYDTSLLNANMSIIFAQDGVYLAQSLISQKLFSYQDYPILNNLDFNNLDNSNWDKIFTVIDSEFTKIKPLLTTTSLMIFLFSTVTDLIIISLILSVFQALTLSRFIRFTKFWKLTIYLLTPYVFGNIFMIMFGFGLLHYIGLLASAIYIIILGRTIAKQSIWKE